MMPKKPSDNDVQRVGDIARQVLGQLAFRSGDAELVSRYQRMAEAERRKAAVSDVIRYNLEISSDLNATLVKLAAQIDGSKAEVLRKAIALMEVAVQAKADGKPFGVGHVGQELAIVIVGI